MWQGFSHFSDLLRHFVMGKLATSNMRVLIAMMCINDEPCTITYILTILRLVCIDFESQHDSSSYRDIIEGKFEEGLLTERNHFAIYTL